MSTPVTQLRPRLLDSSVCRLLPSPCFEPLPRTTTPLPWTLVGTCKCRRTQIVPRTAAYDADELATRYLYNDATYLAEKLGDLAAAWMAANVAYETGLAMTVPLAFINSD